MAQLDALEFAPTSNVLRPRQPQRETLNEQAAQAAPRKTEGDREMQLAVVQIKAAREAAQTAQLCARGEHDFSGCTECRLSKNHGHWAQDCPEAHKAD